MKFGSRNGLNKMTKIMYQMRKIIYPIFPIVFLITSCKNDSKHGKAPDDMDNIMTFENTDSLLERELKSNILQDRLWSSEFISRKSGVGDVITISELVNNQEIYLRWFDLLSPDAQEKINKEYKIWLQNRSPEYIRTFTVSEYMEKIHSTPKSEEAQSIKN